MMTEYEKYSVVIQAGTFVVVASGLLMAYLQLKRMAKISQSNHDWNRRITSLNYAFTDDPDITIRLSRLDKHLQLGQRQKEEISIKEIDDLEKTDYPEIRADIQFVLGRLENMFVAVSQGIADEDVCKDMLSSRVILYHRFFGSYIDDVRRKMGSNRLYENFVHFAQQWRAVEPLNRRSPTG